MSDHMCGSNLRHIERWRTRDHGGHRGWRVRSVCTVCGQNILWTAAPWVEVGEKIDSPRPGDYVCEGNDSYLDWIRRTYGVPARCGMQVTYRGRSCLIVYADHRLRLRPLDGGRTLIVHPTDDALEYPSTPADAGKETT